jgi:hypothetical protein
VYAVLQVFLEAWWEYTLFYVWDDMPLYFAVFAHLMLLAHWLYFLAPFLSMFDDEEASQEQEDQEDQEPHNPNPERERGRKKEKEKENSKTPLIRSREL